MLDRLPTGASPRTPCQWKEEFRRVVRVVVCVGGVARAAETSLLPLAWVGSGGVPRIVSASSCPARHRSTKRLMMRRWAARSRLHDSIPQVAVHGPTRTGRRRGTLPSRPRPHHTRRPPGAHQRRAGGFFVDRGRGPAHDGRAAVQLHRVNVMKKHRGRRRIVLALIVAALVAAVYFGWPHLSQDLGLSLRATRLGHH